MSSILVKICGLNTKEAIMAISDKISYAGFVFHKKSPRNIEPEAASQLIKELNKNIKTVAVLVSPTNNEIENILKYFKPDYIQLHGNETKNRISDIRKNFNIKIIKAIAVLKAEDLEKANIYSDVADILLFDTKVPGSAIPGGNGIAFDWNLLKNQKFSVPWFISGGINTENVAKAINISGAKMIDISSGLESKPGLKDINKIKNFIKEINNYKKLP